MAQLHGRGGREVPAPLRPGAARSLVRGGVGAVVVLLLLATSWGAGYLLAGWRTAAAQTAVQTPLVSLRLPAGWSVKPGSPTYLLLKGPDGDRVEVTYQETLAPGDSPQLEFEAMVVKQVNRTFGGPVTSCLPMMRLSIGGKAGLEVGFHDGRDSDQGAACDLAWVAIAHGHGYFWRASQGSTDPFWTAGPTNALRRLVRDNAAMQRSARWQR